jgi:hypothetical protein
VASISSPPGDISLTPNVPVTSRGSGASLVRSAFHDATSANLSKAPWSSLGAALAGLGHECTGGCPDLATESDAVVWFVRLLGTSGASSPRTVVEVEFIEAPFSGGQLRELLREINQCVQDEYIQVSARRVQDPAS